MSLADVTSARSSPSPENCPECDATASVTSDLHKYQVACTCKPGSAQYACADDPGPPPPAKTDTPPALPPRPPTSVLASRRTNASAGCNADASCRRRKYAWWCCGCGALAAALGGLLAAQHILVRAYTASPHHLETVPAAVPAAMLVLTGVCIMSLARRRNRYSYMIKVVGACCLMCALTCVLVTITTTVIHMNKLQTLKFCEYTKLTRTCTCFSMPPDTQHNAGDDEGVRCVFEGVSECGVVHGALYWCLRGVFALSVSAVLVCIFSCMLAYQLLSHERKKMYWEQLELRCRSLYRPPSGIAGAATAGRPVQNTCSCGAQCYPTQPAWDISLQHRFWAPGRIGNLYSPNPGTGRKASAWSWFPWPRSNSQNSRCQMGGVPQSGDSAYGFCDDTPSSNPQASYDDRTYPPDFRQNFPANFTPAANFTPGQMINQAQGFAPPGNFTSSQASFPQGQASFAPGQGSFAQVQGGFAPGQGNFGQYQEGFGESSGSFDAQTGVWGPPPPYSPQGRSGSRHLLHQQDPAAATLLHHHHIEVHRNSVHDHEDHPHTHDHPHNHPHTCRNSYLHHMQPSASLLDRADGRVIQSISGISPDVSHINQDGGVNQDGRMNPEISRMNQELRMNPDPRDRMGQDGRNQDMGRLNSEMSRLNPEMSRMNPDMSRINPEMSRMNPELSRINPDHPEMARMSQMYPEDMEMTHIQDGRFNTLRGHLVPYRCQRMDISLHRDCRIDEGVTTECSHQKSASKVSDQSSDSCKHGKENLGFQNDKHSPIRSSMQDCRTLNQNAESEVYFADVSSCCNVSVKAECCINPNVSLVGTIENHPESTSESDTGSFTLTRQQRPQPQVGSKRRPNKHKPDKIRQNLNPQEKLRQNVSPQEKLRQNLNSSLRLTEHQIEQLNLRMNERNDLRMNERHDSRDRLNDSMRERGLNDSIREPRDRLNDSIRGSRVDSRDRLSDSRNELDRMNDSRVSDRMNETRLSERMSERVCDRMNDSRLERMNDSRISERLNDSRLDRLNDSRVERISDPRIERMNDSRICDRMNEARLCERMIDPRLNDSRITRINDSCDRMNESRDRNDSRHERMNESRISDRIERMTDLNSSIRIEGSPKIRTHISPLRVPMPRTSPKSLSKDHPRQSSSDSNKADFFVPPPPIISPLSPNTEESLLSDDDRPQDTVYSNEPEASKCLGPDSQYEPEKNEILKTNHHHCYSDTNTMDSGWQSGSEKQVTD